MVALRSEAMKALVQITGNHRIRVSSPVEVRAKQYNAHAAECEEFAQHALSRDNKAILENMAVVWRHLAELVERFELA
jgi:hypothetical protein